MNKKIVKKPKKLALSVHQEEKSRLVIDCSTEVKTRIKMLAALKNMTIKEFVLSAVFGSECSKSHIPNKETIKALRDSEKEIGNTQHASIDEMFSFLGI